MCIFTGPVKEVSDTKIFASYKNSNQFLVYQMNSDASDVAMVLPLPVARDVYDQEEAVQFIDMSKHENFFSDIDRYIHEDFPLGDNIDFNIKSFARGDNLLPIIEVGDFEASYVPRIADFSRLDERFRLNKEVTLAFIENYSDYGFAVFKLKGKPLQSVVPSRLPTIPTRINKSKKFHPMALVFPTEIDRLFFPTVHIHDSQIHDEESFNHKIYFQGDYAEDLIEILDIKQTDIILGKILNDYTPSVRRALSQVPQSLTTKSKPIVKNNVENYVHTNLPVKRFNIDGYLENVDTILYK